jgi:transposase
MEMNGLEPYHRDPLCACCGTATSHDRRILIVEESLGSQIEPEIARIEALQDRIAHLKSEIRSIQARSGKKIIMAQILDSLKDMQGEKAAG